MPTSEDIHVLARKRYDARVAKDLAKETAKEAKAEKERKAL
jgi:hypothetical protein